MNSKWIVEKIGFDAADAELNGSKFLLGNGYMGYRGTMEEYGADRLVAVNLAGVFDLAEGSNWRESVNAPNPLYAAVSVNGEILHTCETEKLSHRQALDIHSGIHSRETVFCVNKANITVKSERFVSMPRENIMAMKYTISADRNATLKLQTGIDTAVWDISGRHLDISSKSEKDGILSVNAETVQLKTPLRVYEIALGLDDALITTEEKPLRIKEIKLSAGEALSFVKIGGVYHGDAVADSAENFKNAVALGYDELKAEHMEYWENIWEASDVVIEGDNEAQLALRYSIYHLCSIAPHSTDKCGIPARGLSGQVYKGAAFWDTEMFMLPFFSFTDSVVARNLMSYRINTLAGAKRKAKEFGFEGAFYAWESQETGDDACTLFNVTDVFTGRPLRTYFKDKQVHVSADMVYAMWEYCRISGDYSLLRDGGLEMIYECVLFFYTYAAFKPHKNRYEVLDVVGPDEYHDRVNNNAFTSNMAKHAADILVLALNKCKAEYPEAYDSFVSGKDLAWAYDFAEKLYVPQPDQNGIIEQFDGYLTLEDVSPADLKARELKEHEYWGGHGLAANTRVLKQADIVMMLNVYRNEYSKEIKKANWEFYEPYTEHGSSLSACAYGIVAAEIGLTDWAYKYFMKTATVDLTGNTKQYLGSQYIGGTHPAANGGSWNTAVFGLAGISYTEDTLDISPRIPDHWQGMSFSLLWRGAKLNISIRGNEVTVKAEGEPKGSITVNGKAYNI